MNAWQKVLQQKNTEGEKIYFASSLFFCLKYIPRLNYTLETFLLCFRLSHCAVEKRLERYVYRSISRTQYGKTYENKE
jgi:hypothetical protein